MYGKGFFTSAKNSFSLITRNIVRTVVLGRVVGFLLFVGKATITIGMGQFSIWVNVHLHFLQVWYHFIGFPVNGSSMDFPRLHCTTILCPS